MGIPVTKEGIDICVTQDQPHSTTPLMELRSRVMGFVFIELCLSH